MTETVNVQTDVLQPRRSNMIGVVSLITGLLPLGSQVCVIAYVVVYVVTFFPLAPLYAYFLSTFCGLSGGIISIILAAMAFFGKTPRKAFPILGILFSVIGIAVIVLLAVPIIMLLFSLGQG